MEIIAGACRAKIDSQEEIRNYANGASFEIPANSGFDIEVVDGTCEYVCSFLD